MRSRALVPLIAAACGHSPPQPATASTQPPVPSSSAHGDQDPPPSRSVDAEPAKDGDVAKDVVVPAKKAPTPDADSSAAKRKPAPVNINPKTMDALRVAGQTKILPDDATRGAMKASGKSQIIGAWKVCIDDTGALTEIKGLKSTGFPDYDAEIEATLHAWRFKPHMVDGHATAACTALTFILAL